MISLSVPHAVYVEHADVKGNTAEQQSIFKAKLFFTDFSRFYLKT